MPLIKEVFFKNKKRIIAFLNKEEMLSKAELWLSESSKKDPTEKQKSILKSLNWFQKITFAGKELFVEKSGNPLKVKPQLIEREDSEDSIGLKLMFSFFPVCLTPMFLYSLIQDRINKRKVEKGNPVYLKNLNNNINFYGYLFLIINVVAIITLIASSSPYIYLSIFLSNLLLALVNPKTPYLNVENYELMNFTLEENEIEDMDGIEAKILNMKGQEVHVKNKKIEYDFIKDMDFSQNDQPSIKVDENAGNFKRHL